MITFGWGLRNCVVSKKWVALFCKGKRQIDTFLVSATIVFFDVFNREFLAFTSQKKYFPLVSLLFVADKHWKTENRRKKKLRLSFWFGWSDFRCFYCFNSHSRRLSACDKEKESKQRKERKSIIKRWDNNDSWVVFYFGFIFFVASLRNWKVFNWKERWSIFWYKECLLCFSKKIIQFSCFAFSEMIFSNLVGFLSFHVALR